MNKARLEMLRRRRGRLGRESTRSPLLTKTCPVLDLRMNQAGTYGSEPGPRPSRGFFPRRRLTRMDGRCSQSVIPAARIMPDSEPEVPPPTPSQPCLVTESLPAGRRPTFFLPPTSACRRPAKDNLQFPRADPSKAEARPFPCERRHAEGSNEGRPRRQVGQGDGREEGRHGGEWSLRTGDPGRTYAMWHEARGDEKKRSENTSSFQISSPPRDSFVAHEASRGRPAVGMNQQNNTPARASRGLTLVQYCWWLGCTICCKAREHPNSKLRRAKGNMLC